MTLFSPSYRTCYMGTNTESILDHRMLSASTVGHPIIKRKLYSGIDGGRRINIKKLMTERFTMEGTIVKHSEQFYRKRLIAFNLGINEL